MVLLAPSPDTIKTIHETFVKQYGVAGYMSEGMVEGCLERAMTYVYRFQPFPKLFLKAGAILYSFITFHPFGDGNKRTAFETTKIFLRLNGYELIVDTNEGVNFTRAIADQRITDIGEITEWVQSHSKWKLGYKIMGFFTKFVLLTYSGTAKEQMERIPQRTLLLLQAIRIYPD